MRLPTSMRVVVDQFKQTLRLRRLYTLNRYAKLIPPGPRYKEALTNLRAARLDGKIKNDKEEEELLNTLL